MTVQEFQATKSGELKAFLDTNTGKEFLTLLSGLRPGWEDRPELMAANGQQIRGYEQCLRTIVSLTMAPKIVTQPEANYGVPDRQPTKE